MQKIFPLFFLAFFFSCNILKESNAEVFNAQNEKFQYSGRYEKTEGGTALISSAASVKIRVIGDSCTLYMQSSNEHHQYVSIELNEEYLGRFRFVEDSLSVKLPKKEGGSVLTVFKDTEASNGSVIFKGISAENIESPLRTEKSIIEFIGDSITCGMGADTKEIECGEGEWFDQHNAYLAYGPRIARTLGTGFKLSCVSGMGMYRNWNDEDQPVIPEVYSNLNLNSDTTAKADFQVQVPDVVSIAIGTNDLSLGDGTKERTEFSKEKFTENYIAFVEEICSYYPTTKIAFLSSPMVGEKENEILVSSLKDVKANFKDKEIFIFEFNKMEAAGCTGHPNIEDHAAIADQLIPFFADILRRS